MSPKAESTTWSRRASRQAERSSSTTAAAPHHTLPPSTSTRRPLFGGGPAGILPPNRGSRVNPPQNPGVSKHHPFLYIYYLGFCVLFCDEDFAIISLPQTTLSLSPPPERFLEANKKCVWAHPPKVGGDNNKPGQRGGVRRGVGGSRLSFLCDVRRGVCSHAGVISFRSRSPKLACE